ncbi:MAG: hypothetical protein JNM57_12155 [Cyclobacteriaceae bacterium]|nr:hypothetical protein [Cyclobacteriaceae bacterium]
MRKSLVRKCCVMVSFVLLAITFASAQPQNPTGEIDPPVPITGIEWLIAAGVALGVKRITDLRKLTRK